MTYTVIFKPAATEEAAEAYLWYEEQDEALAVDFKQSVDEIVSAITQFPESYPVVYKNLRRALTRRFPYAVFYSVEANRIIVHAVSHVRRDPKEWRDRA